jgi:ABC-2 type transport system ATP-binding protein
MPTVSIDHISKNFGTMKAVDDVSFNVNDREIFGLLGPNGAGKTTSIRILLDIFKPDHGSVSIFGGPMSEDKKNRIGYLPEERGLYQDITLERCLVYLATLKGLTKHDAQQSIINELKRFDLYDHRSKKVKELSKGMQQKAQLIATLVHRPELVIIDEPFSSLDPINTQMVKDLLREERDKGNTIIMCTHQMHQVEELCDRIVLINKGEVMLYGSLSDIRQKFTSQDIILRTPAYLPDRLPGVKAITPHNGSVKLSPEPGKTSQDILLALLKENITIEQFEIAVPTLDEIFIKVVKEAGE